MNILSLFLGIVILLGFGILILVTVFLSFLAIKLITLPLKDKLSYKIPHLKKGRIISEKDQVSSQEPLYDESIAQDEDDFETEEYY